MLYNDVVMSQSPLYYWRMTSATNGNPAIISDPNTASVSAASIGPDVLLSQKDSPSLTASAGYPGFLEENQWVRFRGQTGDSVCLRFNCGFSSFMCLPSTITLPSLL